MSREIKFRAWFSLANEMVCDGDEWLPPQYSSYDYIKKPVRITNLGIFFEKCRRGNNGYVKVIDSNGVSQDYYSSWDDDDLHMSDLKIMQFTGLTDKNGVDIYEGDIVVNRDMSGSGLPRKFRPRKVAWSENSCEFNVSAPFGGGEIEVVGNIHQNPELLEA